MKLLMITCRADVGGGPEHVRVLVKYLRKVAPALEIFIASPKEPPYYEYYRDLVNDDHLKVIPHRKFGLTAVLKLIYFVKRAGISVVHSHGKGAGAYSRFIKLFCWNVKVVHTFHGLHIGHYSATETNIYRIYERAAALITKKIIAVSASEKNLIREFLPRQSHKIRLIENGVEISLSGNKKPGKKNRLIMLMTSRFDYQKNTAEAVQIVEMLVQRGLTAVELIVLGDGQERDTLAKKIPEKLAHHISFVGNVKDVKRYLDNADIYLNTSRWEGLSLGMLEALSSGVPVVASRVAGNIDLVCDSENGYLYDLHDIQGAVHSIMLIANDEDLRNLMGTKARETVRERFEASVMANKTYDLYLN